MQLESMSANLIIYLDVGSNAGFYWMEEWIKFEIHFKRNNHLLILDYRFI